MAGRASPSPSPLSPSRRRRGFGSARKCERCCWTFVTHLPLAFVYGLTTWAIYVEGTLSLLWLKTSWKGYLTVTLGLTLYILLNWSYTTAVFTDPGSPSSLPSTPARRPKNGSAHQYSHLPTHEPSSTTSSVHTDLSSFTVKSTGAARFCKKCQTRKPDRAHHCSTCRRCVLKMDHHCPWLATCVGLRNYKPFLLFLTYTTFFCWVCFVVSSLTLWTEIVSDARFEEGFLPVNMVLLAVLSGILGLVLTGFTGWHISLAVRNQTTIECLEKTRYLSPIRKGMQRVQMGAARGEDGNVVKRYGQQLAEIHANAIPGATRYEEGEERPSPVPDLEHGLTAREALRMNYDDMERERERQRYEEYLDEQDSEKLPNAFDLGWKRNLFNLLGEQPLLWFLPICNTVGDGWHWEPSTKWLDARESIRLQRETESHSQESRAARSGQRSPGRNVATNASADAGRHYLTTPNGALKTGRSAVRSPSKADKILGRTSNEYADGSFDSGMSMKTLRRKESFDGRTDDGEDQYEVSSDEAECGREETSPRDGNRRGRPTGSRNRDLADDDEWREWE